MTREELEGLSLNGLKEYIRARFRRETADPPLGPPGDDYPHAYLSPPERVAVGVTDGLVRLSVGIEERDDILSDLKQALARC